MPDPNISKEDLHELVQYLHRIQAFEKWYVYRLQGLSSLMWGLLMILGGILDYFFSKNAGYGPQPIPWILVLLMGVIFMNYWYSKQNIVFMNTKHDSDSDYSMPVLIAIFVFLFAVNFVLGFYGFIYLIMPWNAFIIGVYFYWIYRQSKKEPFHASYYYLSLVAVLFFSAFLLIALYIIYGSSIVLYHGLIFGVLFGSTFTIISLIIKNKADKMILEGDLGENISRENEALR